MIDSPDSRLLDDAKAGDRAAFDQLFGQQVPKLRGLLYRMVGHPDDVDDLAQQTLLKAHESLGGFRGESSAGTWLCSIGARLAIDHLRSRKRWRERAQIMFAAQCLESEEVGAEVGTALSAPDFSYEVGEHIAYCFTCVGRTLEPEAQAALVLRDVLDLSNDEAATALGLSRSVLRHHLADARRTMQETYDGLCALVNKQGACWQCAGLREAAPEDRRGPPPPDALAWPKRLHVVRESLLGAGKSKALHDVFFRLTEKHEQARMGDENIETNCGRPDDS